VGVRVPSGIEFEGALYHVTSRGDQPGEAIFEDDADREGCMQGQIAEIDEVNVPRVQRRPPPTMQTIAAKHPERDAAMIAAHATGE